MSRQTLIAVLALGWCGLAAAPGSAQSTDADLASASLEKLTQIQVSVSSFARKDEDLWKTPAAVFVISREDIERSAATSIPELLRMVPGMQVAQATASTWAVSARGFNGEESEKLLVLIDGRTVYSEIFSGAHWDEDDLPLGEIERIEVIRGPGAAVWGTNAVNGVVNIITRRTRHTVGFEGTGRVGRIGESTSVRYGGSLGDRAQYRGYLSFVNRAPFQTANGQDAFDGEDTVRGGGRLDWQRSRADWFTLSGSLYAGRFKEKVSPLVNIPTGPDGQMNGSMSGGSLLGRWEHKFAHSDSGLQVYFDQAGRHEFNTYPRSRTVDVDFQDHVPLGSRNDLVWGGEFRFTGDQDHGSVPLLTHPTAANFLVDAFAQDDISLIPERLVVTLGSKIQQGTLAGFQVQPSARILWSPGNSQSLWAAVSRAVVAPTIQDKNLSVPLNYGTAPTPIGVLPVTGILSGNPDYKPETVRAYEGGYRRRFGSSLSLDLAGFFNANKRLLGYQNGTPAFVLSPSPHLDVAAVVVNGFSANTAGTEAALSWKPRQSLSFQAGYSWMQAHLTQTLPGSLSLSDSWSTPRHTVSLSSSWSFARSWSLNNFVYHVDSLPKPTVRTQSADGTNTVPGYTRLDLHLTRKLGRSIEVDAGGTNLLRPRHAEFGNGTDLLVPALVPRSLFAKATWTF